MAIKDILFHLDTSETAQSVSDFAVSLAHGAGAHLTAGAVAIQYLPPDDFVSLGSTQYLLDITDKARQDADEAYKRLLAAVPHGVQTDFVLIETLAAIARDRFGELARHFDLSVVGQGAPETGSEDRLMVAGALFGSGRPVFIVPAKHKGPAKIDKPMVCWDGGAAAARALAGALPLLARATSVEIVRIARGGKSPEELPGFNIARHLARHGIDAALRILPSGGDDGAALLAHATNSGADYMVMVGYGHWRYRELVFGGTTKTILTCMTLPVLMTH